MEWLTHVKESHCCDVACAWQDLPQEARGTPDCRNEKEFQNQIPQDVLVAIHVCLKMT